MNLRTKTFIVITAFFICVFLILAFVISSLVNNNYRREENQLVMDKVQLIHLLIDDSLRGLEKVVVDWAEWDDTYVFVQDKNQAYIDSNLPDSVFFNNRWNLVIIVNSSGDIVFSKAYDLIEGKSISIPEYLNSYISPGGALLTYAETANVKGIISQPEAPMMVVTHPILTGQGSGPRRGTFILGRSLDSVAVERLSNITNLTVKTYNPLMGQTLPEVQSVYPLLLQGTSYVAQPQDTNTIAGYSLLKDINEKPALILRVEIPRTLYSQSKSVISYFTLSLFAFGLVFELAILLLLDRMVLSRIARLSNGVNYIAQKGDPASHLDIGGRDEITHLAGNINNMLDSLTHSNKLYRESEEFSSSLLINSPYPIVVIYPDKSIRYVNPAFEAVTGFTLKELAGRNVPYPWWPADTNGQHLINFNTRFNEPYQTEIMLQRKTGESFWVHINHFIIKDGDTIRFYLSIWMDITEQKLAREELEKLYQREKSVREQLQVEITSRTEFTRAMVHELKTPLTPILASSELLVEELTEEPLLGLAKNVHRGAENMNKRVDELLDLARGEIGMLKINPKPVDLGKLLLEVFKDMELVVQNSGQSFTLELKNELPITMADDDRVRQILLNLINNAIKYSSPGGKITIRAGVQDSNIQVDVQDTGRGISEDEQKNLFQPYYRIEGRERLSGLGLGLTLSKKLVELHGGHIWVTSKKGVGSTFSFSFPLQTKIQAMEDTVKGGEL
jgi:PAS domain S-box-containing protein